MNQNQCLRLAHSFLDQLFGDLESKHISFPDYWEIDHLCYRACSDDSYELLKEEFGQFSELLIESEVNGRLISTFKLRSPVIFRDWMIDLIELPAPKKGKVTLEGFEHIEVVSDWSFEALKKQFHFSEIDEKGLSKDFNQELELVLGDRNVKFHHLSLESVVNLEKNEKVWSALKESKLLSTFKRFYPLIAGSLPLDLEDSDKAIVVLMSSSDLSDIELELTNNLALFGGFTISRGDSSLACSFIYQNQLFEIRAAGEQTPQQYAYQNYLIEERLLKYGGDSFKLRVQDFMIKLNDREKAFSRALGHENLDKLRKISRNHLKQLFSL